MGERVDELRRAVQGEAAFQVSRRSWFSQTRASATKSQHASTANTRKKSVERKARTYPRHAARPRNLRRRRKRQRRPRRVGSLTCCGKARFAATGGSTDCDHAASAGRCTPAALLHRPAEHSCMPTMRRHAAAHGGRHSVAAGHGGGDPWHGSCENVVHVYCGSSWHKTLGGSGALPDALCMSPRDYGPARRWKRRGNVPPGCGCLLPGGMSSRQAVEPRGLRLCGAGFVGRVPRAH